VGAGENVTPYRRIQVMALNGLSGQRVDRVRERLSRLHVREGKVVAHDAEVSPNRRRVV
jgi:hypothetical protein